MKPTPYRFGVPALPSAIARSTFLLLTLLLWAGVSTAQASNDASYKLYRCAVLSDSSACAAAPRLPAVRIEERLEPGSYARYLIYLGRSQSDALAAAARIGEFPVRRVVRVTERQLTDLEKYDRYLGRNHAPATTEETLCVKQDMSHAESTCRSSSTEHPQPLEDEVREVSTGGGGIHVV